MVTRLILLRHGRTGHAGRYIGATDVPLSAEGRKQMRKLGPVFTTMGIESLMTSPLRRCTESLELLGLDLPAQPVAELREIDFGRWEGKSFAEIKELDPELVSDWARGDNDFRFPEGEGLAEFISRIRVLADGLRCHHFQTVLLVTHGGVIRALICELLGLSSDRFLLFQVDKGHYCTIELHSGGGVLTGLNLGGSVRWAD